ncbi:cell wall hydrolase [Methylobrevis pamukkalensis]|uniref:Spore cortex-lytic enzyme n=1 Tax=Methylobrevis pamukkalensis TaxID=1439726 RepID=A0A1E3H454_9HYPH|nr:cell wall hydrolase [Methylobrevis pamukkalensis]ODN70935.1 Spore cortex-lytic enzyme precursor [Methylobrevis pamukkalensis]
MRRNFAWARTAGRLGAVLLAGACASALVPTKIAYQDAASLLTRDLDPETRWTMTLTATAGGSVHVASGMMEEATGTIAVVSRAPDGVGVDVTIGDVDPIITGSINAAAEIPDEDRIDRTLKGDLPMSITTPATPKGFSAGSVYEEHGSFAAPASEIGLQVAFAGASLPLSALAVARFIEPRPALTAVASLEPLPLPVSRPDTTMLVASGYPRRNVAPWGVGAAAEAMAVAYAPDASVVSQDAFDALFSTPKDKPDVPELVVKPGEHWWAKIPLPTSIFAAAEQKCLTEAVYFEARGESYDGQVAVAQVVLNRVRNPAYPATICGVVYQNRHLYNRCQFSFACDRVKDIVWSRKAWKLAEKVADDVSTGRVWFDSVGTATHYHATYVRPNWAGVFHKQAQIGKHVFYQTIYGGWS